LIRSSTRNLGSDFILYGDNTLYVTQKVYLLCGLDSFFNT
jgi:hypothetical protein